MQANRLKINLILTIRSTHNMLHINTHKTVLVQLLKEIYTDSTLGPILGFKGGTAAYFFYDLGRFSVDLDFDLLDDTKSDFVFKKIEHILNRFGTIKEKYIKKNTLFFILSYGQAEHNIKIEVSKRIFGSHYELKNYLGISMLVMIKEDMFAHKLVAMLERAKTANRDIFDAWFFSKNNWPINKEIVEITTGLSFKEYLKKCINFLDKKSNKNILAGIGEFLDEKTKKWAKENLKNDALLLLRLKLEESTQSQ